MSFDFKIGDEIHTHRAEHPYKATVTVAHTKATATTVRRKHSAAFKRRIVARLRNGEPRVKLARDFNLAPSLITAWAQKEKA